MKLYLAGKIGKYDWRHRIVTGLASISAAETEEGSDGAKYSVFPGAWPITPRAIFGTHDYTGPYFVGNDPNHYSYHGRDTHGVGVGMDELYQYDDTWRAPWSPEDFAEADGSHYSYPSDSTSRKHLIKLCLNAIIASDVVFVWMDSTTAYGTLFELGFAVAHRKPIWWAAPQHNNDLDDMWFARTVAREEVYGSDPLPLLRTLLDKHAPTITGYVYLLKSGDHFKIGKSKDVDRRLTQISPRTPLPVALEHSIGSNDMHWLEAQLHTKYARYRTNGEWFALPPDAVAWFKEQTYIRRV